MTGLFLRKREPNGRNWAGRLTTIYFTVYNYIICMGITIDLTDDPQLQLNAVDVTVEEETIQFSVEGEIQQVPDGILNRILGQSFEPSKITFEEV